MSGKTQVIYWTGSYQNVDKTVTNAVITQQFDAPLVEKCTDYVLAVERFEVNLNGIPFYDITLNETITFNFFAGGVVYNVVLQLNTLPNIYSFLELVDSLNTAVAANLILGTYITMTFNCDAFGYLYFSWVLVAAAGPHAGAAITQMTILPDEEINCCLGMEIGDEDNATGTLYSRYPRFDIGDQCEHVRIASNLMLVSDTAGQSKTNIVTDVAAISSYQTSCQGLPNDGGITTFTFSQRQKLCYQPTERRWLNFAAPIGLTYLQIWAEYVDDDGDSAYIPLPRGATFAIKLGFYYRQ